MLSVSAPIAHANSAAIISCSCAVFIYAATLLRRSTAVAASATTAAALDRAQTAPAGTTGAEQELVPLLEGVLGKK